MNKKCTPNYVTCANSYELKARNLKLLSASEEWIMRILKVLSICGVIAIAFGVNSAQARGHVGVVIGVPGPWYPYSGYYYPPPYYYPPVVAVPTAPPTYIEQAAPAQESSDNYWYYCADAKAYYPYVKQCPGGWMRVEPKPTGAP